MGIEFDGMEEDIRDECGELLEAMEDSLLQVQEETIANGEELNRDHINAIFRAAHTLKGTGGMFEISYLEKFAHLAENVLDAVRNGEITLNASILETLLESKDQMQSLVDHALQTQSYDLTPDLQQVSERLMGRFHQLLGSDDQPSGSDSSAPASDTQTESSPTDRWIVEIHPKAESLKSGIEPKEFLKFLDFAGSVEKIETHFDTIPSLENLDPEKCYTRYSVTLTEVDSEQEIHSALELAEGVWDINVKAAESDSAQEAAPVSQPPQQESPAPQENAPDIQKPAPQENKTPDTPTEAKTSPAPKKAASSSTLRVDSKKVDTLINLIGEMVIANANVIQQVSDTKNKELMEAVSFVSRMLEEMRESAMKVRMVQIGDTFNRFKRIVGDLAKELGKEVDFKTHGGETELDKSVIEKIYDPLIHLIRNGLDHGVERPEDRIEKGKPPRGTLTLSACYEAGNITIQIQDDGKGINDKIIYEKAVQKGLIKPGLQLEKKQIFQLIFHPGFSTAEKITNVSGRGVGMDVVKRNIEELRGTLEVDSEVDAGSTITIRLPLTLAIIDGLLVRIAESHYVIPLEMISECIEFTDRFQQQITSNHYVNLRGKLLPILDMREFFYGSAQKKGERDNIVVVHNGGQSVGLLVDELHGEFQAVIKPLGKVFQNIQGISGATILGTGAVALILDIPVLLRYVNIYFDNHLQQAAS